MRRCVCPMAKAMGCSDGYHRSIKEKPTASAVGRGGRDDQCNSGNRKI